MQAAAPSLYQKTRAPIFSRGRAALFPSAKNEPSPFPPFPLKSQPKLSPLSLLRPVGPPSLSKTREAAAHFPSVKNRGRPPHPSPVGFSIFLGEERTNQTVPLYTQTVPFPYLVLSQTAPLNQNRFSLSQPSLPLPSGELSLHLPVDWPPQKPTTASSSSQHAAAPIDPQLFPAPRKHFLLPHDETFKHWQIRPLPRPRPRPDLPPVGRKQDENKKEDRGSQI